MQRLAIAKWSGHLDGQLLGHLLEQRLVERFEQRKLGRLQQQRRLGRPRLGARARRRVG
jgi:hypothetical protein